MEFVYFFPLILLIVVSFVTFSDINKKQQNIIIEVIEETGEIQSVTNEEESIAIAIVLISVLLLLGIILLVLWISDYVRFIFVIEGSLICC